MPRGWPGHSNPASLRRPLALAARAFSSPRRGHDPGQVACMLQRGGDPGNRHRREADGWATGWGVAPAWPRARAELTHRPGGALPRPVVAGGFGHPGCWEPLLLPCGVTVQGLPSLHPHCSALCSRLHWRHRRLWLLCPLPLRDKVLLRVSSEQLHEVGRACVTYVH